MNIPVLINGTEYSAVDVKVAIAGIPVFGMSAITVEEEQEKQDYYGLGSDRPVTRRRGKITATGSITLYPVEVNAIQDAVPERNLLYVAPFDVTMVLAAKNSSVTQVVVLKNVEFTKNSRGFNTGSMDSDVELPLILSHVKWAK